MDSPGRDLRESFQGGVEFKVVVIGATDVGKTSLTIRYVHDEFHAFSNATIGASFLQKHVTVEGNRITLQIWDTAGQERFRAMAPLYYRNAKAAVVVFDITDDRTFRKAKGWVDELKKHVPSDIVLIVCANKVDMLEEFGGSMPMGAVSDEELEEYVTDMDAQLFRTSAKSNIGVDGLFDAVAQRLLKLYIKERENELLRAREHRSSASGRAPSPNDDSFVRRREDSFNRKLKIGESRANSRRSEGCC